MLGDPVSHTGLELLAVHVHTEEFGGVTLAVVVIDKGLYLSGDIGILGQRGSLAPREVVLVRDTDVVLYVSGLGSDKHHTEGCAGTVDRCRCSILEYRDALDVVGVEVRQVVGGHTVNDVERSGNPAVREGTDTTNHERSLGVDTAVVVQDGKTGNGSLQSLADVGLALRLKSLAHVDVADGAGEVGFSLLSVTHDHDFVEECFILGQTHVEARTRVQSHSLVTHIRDLDFAVATGAERETSVDIGGSATSCTELGNCGADNGLTILIGHGARHSAELCRL